MRWCRWPWRKRPTCLLASLAASLMTQLSVVIGQAHYFSRLSVARKLLKASVLTDSLLAMRFEESDVLEQNDGSAGF